MEELGPNGLKLFKKTVRFGDIIVNYWASEDKPCRKGVFIKFHTVMGMSGIQCRNDNGDFYTLIFNEESKLKIIGTILN